MKFTDWLWTNKTTEEIRCEAFQPTDEQRECPSADTSIARLEALDQWDAAVEKACSTLAALHAPPRPTARVFLIRSPRVPLYPLALFFKSRGYRLKQDGRGYIEAIR